MYDLYLNDRGNTAEACHLSPLSSAVTAMRYHPGAGDGQHVTDRVELVLEGDPGGIELLMESIERWLEQAGHEAGWPGGGVQLWARVDQHDGGEYWRSRVLGGRVRLAAAGADQRIHGVQGLVVEICREDAWESSTLHRARLSNGGGDNEYGPLALRNHRDAQHWNSLAYPRDKSLPTSGPTDLTGSLPVGGVLTWKPVTQPHPLALTVLIGHGCRSGISRLVDTYPAEAWRPPAGNGVNWTSLTDPACADGQYLQLDWTGSAEVTLLTFSIAWSDVQILAGGPVRLVLRLQDSLSTAAGEKLWYRWRAAVLEGSTPYPAGESSSQYMETNQELVIGPLMNLPPWQVEAGPADSNRWLRLELVAQAAGSGAHTLRLDTITVLPCDGWRIYRPVTSRPTYGLVEDQPRGLVLGAEGIQTHAAEGPGFTLLPLTEQRWWVFALRHEASGEKTAPIELESTLEVEFYVRKRVI